MDVCLFVLAFLPGDPGPRNIRDRGDRVVLRGLHREQVTVKPRLSTTLVDATRSSQQSTPTYLSRYVSSNCMVCSVDYLSKYLVLLEIS